jgi:hypothetical protein
MRVCGNSPRVGYSSSHWPPSVFFTGSGSRCSSSPSSASSHQPSSGSVASRAANLLEMTATVCLPFLGVVGKSGPARAAKWSRSLEWREDFAVCRKCRGVKIEPLVPRRVLKFDAKKVTLIPPDCRSNPHFRAAIVRQC